MPPSSTSSTFSPGDGLGHDAPRLATRAGRAKGKSTVKVAPAPGTLVTPIRPSISSTSRLEMARPRPVPLCRRAGPLSACSNSAKMRSIASGGTPGPVSRTAKRSMISAVPPRAAPGVGCSVSATPPLSVNLMALPIRFIRIWRTRISSPITVFGKSRSRQPADLQCLVAGARRQQLDHPLRGVGDVERSGAELDLARLDLGEVEHLVDQRQQRLGRGGDGAGISALLGRELGVERGARSCRECRSSGF